MEQEFSPSRRNFIKNIAKTGLGLVLAPQLETIANVFQNSENKEQDPEQKYIQDRIVEYNNKYPKIEDKIKEQKEWFTQYINSELYKKLLTKEFERALQIDANSTEEEKKILEEFVNSVLEDRKLKVENVHIFIDKKSDNEPLARTFSANRSGLKNRNLQCVINCKSLPTNEDVFFLGIIVNKKTFNSWASDNFEGITTICHELHHITLTTLNGPSGLEQNAMETTKSIFEKVLLKEKLSIDYSGFGSRYILDSTENMARIIAARRTLHLLGKMESINDSFEEKHIVYLKKYIKILFPEKSSLRYLFGGDFKLNNKEIDNNSLLEIMNSFASMESLDELKPNSRMG